MSQPFQQKMVKVIGLADYLPLEVPVTPTEWVEPSGIFSGLGSNSTLAVPSASGNLSTDYELVISLCSTFLQLVRHWY